MKAVITKTAFINLKNLNYELTCKKKFPQNFPIVSVAFAGVRNYIS